MRVPIFLYPTRLFSQDTRNWCFTTRRHPTRIKYLAGWDTSLDEIPSGMKYFTGMKIKYLTEAFFVSKESFSGQHLHNFVDHCQSTDFVFLAGGTLNHLSRSYWVWTITADCKRLWPVWKNWEKFGSSERKTTFLKFVLIMLRSQSFVEKVKNRVSIEILCEAVKVQHWITLSRNL